MSKRTRWMVEKKRVNRENELLRVIEVYAPSEKLKVVRRENKDISYDVEKLEVVQ